MNVNQHCFTKGKSTVTNLITALNIWTESLSHGIPIDVIYLDFSKAFDKVPHQRLVNQLYNFGISGKCLSWIQNFLSNRIQMVRVNDEVSQSTDVKSGVPQGSVLGPTLFLIYISQINEDILNFTSLFADDSKLFSYILESSEDHHTSKALQEDLNKLISWSERMQMSFNLDKCHTLHLGKNNPKNEYEIYHTENMINKISSTAYTLSFWPLKPVPVEKDLGVYIDTELKFTDHISIKVSKAKQMVNIIRSTFKYLQPSTFKLLYTSLVRPHLEYCTPVWSPHLRKDILRVESVQRRATRMITGFSDMSYEERLTALDLPTLEYRRLRADLILLYNHTENLVNLDLQTFCPRCPGKLMFEPAINHQTRGHSKKFQIQHHPGARSHFFSTRSLPIWNVLKEKTVSAKSLNAFKNSLKSDPAMPNKFQIRL